jgi:polynucleotide 5'-kinase involved in rRNA processing
VDRDKTQGNGQQFREKKIRTLTVKILTYKVLQIFFKTKEEVQEQTQNGKNCRFVKLVNISTVHANKHYSLCVCAHIWKSTGANMFR